MVRSIKSGFRNKLVNVALSELQVTKPFSGQVKQGRKYGQILSSIREIGLIEPPAIAPFKQDGKYLLLDGHMRIMALKELGEERVDCLVSTDDEAYTYNKYINRLSAVQEHKMIVKALDAGVSEAKLAKVLNIDVRSLQSKKNMLDGICPEAVELLKDKILSEHVFRVLKKMKPVRQVKAAMIMNDHNRHGYTFAKNLLDATPVEQLVDGRKPQRVSPAILEKQIRLEEENISLSEDIQSLKETYGKDIFDLTLCQAYLKRIMSNEKVSDYLKQLHPAIFNKFSEIIKLDILSTGSLGS
jgi:hypothetical protein